jgi:tetratricopeptide (TPR) repeat protein
MAENSTDEFIEMINELNQRPISCAVLFWLNGIPQSNEEDIKRDTKKSLTLCMVEKYSDAIKLTEDLLENSKISPNEKMALHLILSNYKFLNNALDDAIENYKLVLELFSQVTDNSVLEGKAAALRSLGYISYESGDLEVSLKYYQDAVEAHTELGDKLNTATDLTSVCIIVS